MRMTKEALIELVTARLAQVKAVLEPLDDETALSLTPLFEEWYAGRECVVGERLRYEDHLYRCEQAHTSQSDWTPDVVPALWTRISIEEFPEWRQPTGAQDAYQTGDKVSHNDKHWVSTADNNVWEPGVYGWEEV